MPSWIALLLLRSRVVVTLWPTIFYLHSCLRISSPSASVHNDVVAYCKLFFILTWINFVNVAVTKWWYSLYTVSEKSPLFFNNLLKINRFCSFWWWPLYLCGYVLASRAIEPGFKSWLGHLYSTGKFLRGIISPGRYRGFTGVLFQLCQVTSHKFRDVMSGSDLHGSRVMSWRGSWWQWSVVVNLCLPDREDRYLSLEWWYWGWPIRLSAGLVA